LDLPEVESGTIATFGEQGEKTPQWCYAVAEVAVKQRGVI
jgi:hypothetical protein